MSRYLLLALATLSFAADLPRYDGYVNDFAGRLAPAERDTLERRLRDYERASSNEVAVAIVESLDGESVDAYARRLFRAWGIGKQDRNNGVLLLWAPTERKVRIQVGYGLEGTLSDRAAARILRDVTDAFRREDYVGGLSAGIDGIIGRLDGTSRTKPEVIAIPLLAAAGLAAAAAFFVARLRKRQLAASLPHDLERAPAAMRDVELLRSQASRDFDALRKEAPEEIWREFDGAAEGVVPELTDLYRELPRIQAMPRERLRDLARAHREWKRWNRSLQVVRGRLESVGARVDSFRRCREQSATLFSELSARLVRYAPVGGSGKAAKLVTAAGETYARAASAAAASPVNWLLVYDLLLDTQDLLGCADRPGPRPARARNWAASAGYSPAYDLLVFQAADASTYSASDSGSSASFGGGDCGGGGASSSY